MTVVAGPEPVYQADLLLGSSPPAFENGLARKTWKKPAHFLETEPIDIGRLRTRARFYAERAGASNALIGGCMRTAGEVELFLTRFAGHMCTSSWVLGHHYAHLPEQILLCNCCLYVLGCSRHHIFVFFLWSCRDTPVVHGVGNGERTDLLWSWLSYKLLCDI
jgi:hypothetical protein